MTSHPSKAGFAPTPGQAFIITAWSAVNGTDIQRPWIGIICSRDMLDEQMWHTRPEGADVQDLSNPTKNPYSGIPYGQRQWAVWLPFQGSYRWVKKSQLHRLKDYGPKGFIGKDEKEESDFKMLYQMAIEANGLNTRQCVDLWKSQITHSNTMDETIASQLDIEGRGKKRGSKWNPALNPLEDEEETFRDDFISALKSKTARTNRHLRRFNTSSMEQSFEETGGSTSKKDREKSPLDSDNMEDEVNEHLIDLNIEMSRLQEKSALIEQEIRQNQQQQERQQKTIGSQKQGNLVGESREQKRKHQSELTLEPIHANQQFNHASYTPDLLTAKIDEETDAYIQLKDGNRIIKPNHWVERGIDSLGCQAHIVEVFVGQNNTVVHVIAQDLDRAHAIRGYVQTRYGKKYIMDPKFKDIEPKVFGSVAEWLNTGEYHPRLEVIKQRDNLSTSDNNRSLSPRYRLQSSGQSLSFYSKELLKLTSIYQLAEEFHLRELQRLTACKIQEAFPKGYQASSLLQAATVLFQDYSADIHNMTCSGLKLATTQSPSMEPTNNPDQDPAIMQSSPRSISDQQQEPEHSTNPNLPPSQPSTLHNFFLTLLAQSLETLGRHLGDEWYNFLDHNPALKLAIYWRTIEMARHNIKISDTTMTAHCLYCGGRTGRTEKPQEPGKGVKRIKLEPENSNHNSGLGQITRHLLVRKRQRANRDGKNDRTSARSMDMEGQEVIELD